MTTCGNNRVMEVKHGASHTVQWVGTSQSGWRKDHCEVVAVPFTGDKDATFCHIGSEISTQMIKVEAGCTVLIPLPHL